MTPLHNRSRAYIRYIRSLRAWITDWLLLLHMVEEGVSQWRAREDGDGARAFFPVKRMLLLTHIKEVKYILEQTGPIGRRLDFMMQELNREANTLSSKSMAVETTQAAVSLKVLIEQMREQIQNIE